MRTRTCATAVGLFIAAVLPGQTAGIGIKGGLLASTAKSLVIRTQPIPGATAGIYFPWGIGPMMELQPELLLTTLGCEWIEPDGDTYTERSLYFQVPITLKYFLNNGFNLALGYQFGKPLMATRSGTTDNEATLARYNILDMGFTGGVGMDFEHGLDLSLRAYSATIPHLRNDDALFPKHRAVQFTLGYRFTQFRGAGHHQRRR